MSQYTLHIDIPHEVGLTDHHTDYPPVWTLKVDKGDIDRVDPDNMLRVDDEHVYLGSEDASLAELTSAYLDAVKDMD